MRLDKFLCDMSQGNRSDLKKMIRKGAVLVNGQIARDPGQNVLPTDQVTLSGKLIPYAETEYYMLHKPAGILTATEDKKQQTVLDLMKGVRRSDLFPVGRLDKDTEGLLLITNDEQLSHRLLSPKSHVDKVYHTLVQGICDENDIQAFEEGFAIGEDLVTLPAILKIISTDPAAGTSTVLVTIREGKFHQIKKMFEVRGKQVLYLKRLSMGTLTLDPDLPAGSYRPLTPEEVDSLLNL